MCPTRIDSPFQPIELDLSAAFPSGCGLGRADLLQLGPQLEAARRKWLTQTPCDSEESKGTAPNSLAQHLLAEYKTERHESILAKILAAAANLRDTVDRAVVLGPPRFVAAAHALFTACCHPHHNDLSRGERGGRPRVFFAPPKPDNDALAGLFDVLPHGRLLRTVDERWGLIVIGSRSPDRLTGGLFRLFWDRLQATSTADEEAALATAVGTADSELVQFAQQTGCGTIEVGSEFAECIEENLFHPGVLLAASVMGMDIVKLLRGAAAMTERFVSSPPGNNLPLDFAGLCHLFAARQAIEKHLFNTSSSALGPALKWLSPEANTGPNSLMIQCLVEGIRTDSLRVTMPAEDAANDALTGVQRRKRVTVTLADIAAREVQSQVVAGTAAGLPTAIVRIPIVDESTVGQLVQMFAFATGIERILSGEPPHALAPDS